MSPGQKFSRYGLVAGVLVLLAFQNCAQMPEDSSLSSSLETLTPFAYDAKIDTLAYMSCSGMSDAGPNRRAFFTFRGGAYTPGISGMAVRPEFREKLKFYNVDQIARIFSISEKNGNTSLSMSIRSSTDYRSLWKESETKPGEELDQMIPDLSAGTVAGPLAALKGTQRINYFPGVTQLNVSRLMEGSLRYYHYENVMQETRSYLHDSKALLTIGYSGTTDRTDTTLRLPEDNPNAKTKQPINRAYGTGYLIKFGQPFDYTGGPARVLSSISEINLENGQPQGGDWDCSAWRQYRIWKSTDVAAGGCVAAPDPDPSTLNGDQQLALQAIRRVLPVEDWYVDVANRCVVPARGQDHCYGPANNRTVQYALTACVEDGTRMCPHMVSICLRQ